MGVFTPDSKRLFAMCSLLMHRSIIVYQWILCSDIIGCKFIFYSTRLAFTWREGKMKTYSPPIEGRTTIIYGAVDLYMYISVRTLKDISFCQYISGTTFLWHLVTIFSNPLYGLKHAVGPNYHCLVFGLWPGQSPMYWLMKFKSCN